MSPEARLSKSQFIRGLQCHKSLWLYRNRKELIPPVSEAQQMIFDQGHEVGLLAHRRFPGGVLIAEDHLHPEEALASTRAAIASGARVLYEAAALADGVLIRADVLVKRGSAWDFVEVKSSAELKEVYLSDAAVQRHVLEGAGLSVGKVFLMHVDTAYVREGDIDPERFFVVRDVSAQVSALLKGVPAQLEAMRDMLRLSRAPEIGIGAHCYEPYECAFVGHCWSDVPEYSVFDLGGARFEKKTALWKAGVRTVADIPDETPLSEAQAVQVSVARSGRPHIDAAAVAELLKELAFPLHFLDFEAVNPAIPAHDGLRPFQQLPFQASVHIQDREGGPLRHEQYLGDGARDPRPGLVSFLAEVIGPKGAVVAYNKGFEGTCLKELAESHPARAAELLSMRERLWDLAGPFRKAYYMHPGFQGSWSIKNVLPALVPGMSYENLVIKDGTGAQLAYLRLMRGELSPAEAREAKEQLGAYCGQDTLAMAELLKVLRADARRRDGR